MANEIVFGPAELHSADVGTAMPNLSAVPPAAWTKFGAVGKRGIATGGVTVSHTQEFVEVMTDGSSGIRDARLTTEGITVAGAIIDQTLEVVALLLQGKSVATVAAAADVVAAKEIKLYSGPSAVKEYALLVRVDDSAYGSQYDSQLWLPRVYSSSQLEKVITKENPVSVGFEFKVMEWEAATSNDDRFGRWQHQTGPAL